MPRRLQLRFSFDEHRISDEDAAAADAERAKLPPAPPSLAGVPIGPGHEAAIVKHAESADWVPATSADRPVDEGMSYDELRESLIFALQENWDEAEAVRVARIPLAKLRRRIKRDKLVLLGVHVDAFEGDHTDTVIRVRLEEPAGDAADPSHEPWAQSCR